MAPRRSQSHLDPLRRRNDTYFDWWSLTHLAWAAVLAVFLPAFFALALMVLWEPLEILVLSPLLGRRGIDFGHESLRNTLMDIVFDVAGVLLGAGLIRPSLGLGLGW
jgi:hypothetical protein